MRGLAFCDSTTELRSDILLVMKYGLIYRVGGCRGWQWRLAIVSSYHRENMEQLFDQVVARGFVPLIVDYDKMSEVDVTRLPYLASPILRGVLA